MTPYDEVFFPIFLSGCLIAGILSLVAGLKSGWLVPGFLLILGVISVWAALFLGSDMGYRAWQSMDNPPEEAFSDASVFGALIAGWVPGILLCTLVFGVSRGIRWILKRADPALPESSQKPPSPTAESGNPYQSPPSS